MSRYASQTDVPAERSRAEIERTLARYGADQFMYGWQEEAAVLAFRAHNRHVKFVLPLPRLEDKEIALTEKGRIRSAAQAEAALNQAIRQRWRALALVIKAKLEVVEAGIVTFEDEFMAHIILPDGQTAGQWMRPQIASAYQTGNMPALLPYYGGENG